MKQRIGLIILVLFGMTNLRAQDAVDKRTLIDVPTAATLDRGSFDINLRMFANGGLLGAVAVGITPRFMFGLSYGGENVIGAGDVNWNPAPGIQARVRLLDESFATPAVTIGFDSQGYGAYDDALNRYRIKSKGFFVALSKNYPFLFNLGLHGGLNLSLENDDNDKDLNLFLGADLSFSREFRFMLEYDLARNDDSTQAFGSGDGYLNAGVQWIFSDRLFLEFYLKNILENGQRLSDVSRVFKIGYLEYF
ncbi:MAG: hypothetical protein ACE5HO_17590 [bacterium]